MSTSIVIVLSRPGDPGDAVRRRLVRRLAAAGGAAAVLASPEALADTLADAESRERIVLVSGLAAAGPRPFSDGDLDESVPPAPADAAGRDLLDAETLARRACAASAPGLAILRPAALYGDGEAGDLAPFLAAPGAEWHARWSDLVAAPVHVEDLAQAVGRALAAGDGVYHVTGGQSITAGGLLADLAIAFGSRPGCGHRAPAAPQVPPPPSSGAVHWPYGASRAARELGYVPRWSLVRGVIDHLDRTGCGLPVLEVAEAGGALRTLLLNTPSPGRRLNRDMGGGLGFVHDNDDRFPPLDLLWLAASLEARGWPVEVLDAAVIEPPSVADLVHHVVAGGIHAVVAEVNLPTFEADLALLRELKRYTAARVVAKSVLSGEDFHARLVREAGVDFVLAGECDLTVADILLGRDLRGTVRLRDGEILAVPEEKLAELDRLPVPARHLLDQSPYRYALLTGPGFTTIQSSRGCPYSCGYYCPYPMTQGKAWRARSAAHVVAEIEACARLGLRNFLFRDATFTLSRARTVEFCRLLAERVPGASWWCETRINCLDEELLRLMARAGCRGINFGLESGSDEVLGSMAKQGVDVRRIREVLAAAARAGIHSHLLVAVGLPDETRTTIAATYDLACELPAGSLGVTGITPLPGTPMWEDARRNDWILSTEWSRYGGNDTVMRTGHLSAADIRFAARMIHEGFRLRHRASPAAPVEVSGHRGLLQAWVRGEAVPPV